MAHFAELDDNNIVQRVIVVNNDELIIDGEENEQHGISFCSSLFSGRWIQTSYNGRIRKNYAGEGFLYDPIRDAFVPPQPFPSWILNEETCKWEAPVPYPTDSGSYVWNEETQTWEQSQP